MSSKTLKYSAAALVAGTSMFLALPALAAGLTDSQISAITALLSSFGADTSVISNVTIALHGGTPANSGQGGQGGGDNHGNATSTDWGRPKLPPMWVGSSTPLALCPQFKHDFKQGSTDGRNGGEISKLQQYLKDSGTYTGPVSGYFGKMTEGAFEKWQQMASSTASSTVGTPPSPNASPRSLLARYCNGWKQDDNHGGQGGGDDHHGGPMNWTGTSTPPMPPPPPPMGTTTASTTH
jgi:hypothetical protein